MWKVDRLSESMSVDVPGEEGLAGGGVFAKLRLVMDGMWGGVQRRSPPPPGPPLAGGELVLRTAGGEG